MREFYRLASLRELFINLVDPVTHPRIHQRLHLLDVSIAILCTLYISIEIDDRSPSRDLSDSDSTENKQHPRSYNQASKETSLTVLNTFSIFPKIPLT